MSRGVDVVVDWCCWLVWVLVDCDCGRDCDDVDVGCEVFRTTTSTVAPELSSNVRMVRRGTSVLATIIPTTQTNRIGWFW